MKVIVVINPISGGKDKTLFLQHLVDISPGYGITLCQFETSPDTASDRKKLAAEFSKFKPDRLLAIGGDGTVLFAAQQIIGKNIPMGIIPFGSADGLATELNISSDPKVALNDFYISRYIAHLDLIKVNDEHFCIHIGDIGLNARIVEGFSNDQKRGFFGYVKHFLSEIQAAELIDFDITADGKQHQHTGYILALANARKYGTGAILNKKGNPFDGKFELVVGLRKDIESILYMGLTKFTEEIDMQDIVEVISCKKAEIRLKEPQLLQLDGELIGKTNYIKAEIMPGIVPIVLQNNQTFESL
jgi:diacylglycerol kinase family enzyme